MHDCEKVYAIATNIWWSHTATWWTIDLYLHHISACHSEYYKPQLQLSRL